MYDPQAQAVYLIDHIVWKLFDPSFSELLSLSIFKRWANAAFRDALQNPVPYQTVFSTPGLKVTSRPGEGARAFQQRHVIEVGQQSMSRWIALHEIAHLLTPTVPQWHGPEFVHVYAALITRHVGQEAGETFMRYCRRWAIDQWSSVL